VRTVTDQMVRTAADPNLLERVAEAVEHAAAMLEPVTPAWVPHVSAKVSADGDPHGYFPFSPMIGQWNPLAPPIDLVVHDGIVTGEGTLGAAYEGPPGCVHGGVIAALFDELLGVANIAAGQGAMTGTLTIRYRRPTPLQQELQFAARTVNVEGRKVFATGEIRHGGEVTAEAEGTFIDVPPSKFTALADQHAPDGAAS
jgi:acyl-coenzyme A thioesterase PaaI-like protein